jgi:ABC-type lipoprotein export system ATPase subunit
MEPLVRADALTKVYVSSKMASVRALDGVSVTIERGEYAAIVGESGSGKTTLMHLLGGLDRPTTGTIVVDGKQFDRASRRELARIRAQTVGFVFQGFNLIPTLNARDNVLLAARYEPALLLADEPTGELDSRTAGAILDLFDQLNARGQTIVVVTHSAAVERRARRVIRVADGRIVSDGS